uniref:Uncharacterized protein n=1 Tax=Pseudomonas phage Cygsa01 TaxID=3138529 RepID=A0AAU6W4E5_9VIRU
MTDKPESKLTEAMDAHRKPSSIRGHRRARPPVHQVVANMSVERGNVIAVLTKSEAVKGYPLALRVFRVDDDGHEIHIDTILAVDEQMAREELLARHNLHVYANLTTEMSRKWKETYRLGAPLPMVDLPKLLLETFCAVREHQIGQMSEAEANDIADRLRSALGMPRWGTDEDFPSLDVPYGVNTSHGPVYGQPEAICFIRDLLGAQNAK